MFEKVSFHGIDATPIVGTLHRPDSKSSRLVGVVLIGPMTYCKEQAPTEYAKRLASRGYAALVFDPRYRGESGGQPRYWENPIAKVEDIQSAVSYLSSRKEVDPEQIAGVSICQGGSEMLRAAADDPRIRVIATVAGHYRDHEGDISWLSQEGYQERLEKARAAARTFEATGKSEEIPAVDRVNPNVAMPGELVWGWYHSWAERRVWENRYARLSDEALLGFESLSAARRLRTPWLMVHSDECMLPDAAKRHFDAAPMADKRLVWEGKTPHLDYYDHAETLDKTVDKIDHWFGSHLSVELQIRTNAPPAQHA